MKFNKWILLITSLVTLLPVAVGGAFWSELPSQMASHWGFAGEPDQWMDRALLVLGLPLVRMYSMIRIDGEDKMTDVFYMSLSKVLQFSSQRAFPDYFKSVLRRAFLSSCYRT